MSSIKDLFKKHSNTTLEDKSLEAVATEVESVGYIKDYLKKKNRFLPHVDFSSASNFVKYGSAEKYYDDSINRILKNYPYDGSHQEKLEWENSSSGVDLYIFNNEYPRTNGYVTFGGNPSTGYAIDSAQPGNPTSKEYIIFYGGPHTASSGMTTTPLYKTFSGSNVWSPTENQESNLKFDLSSGATMEFWVKFGDLDPDVTTQTQVLFDLSNSQLSGSDASSPYGRFYVYYYNNGAAATSGLKASLQSGSVATSTMLYSISDGLTLTSTGSWNHYAITVVNDGSDLAYQVYENGTIVNTVTETGQAINEITGALVATVGALNSAAYTTPGVTTGSIGWYKTSGSVDEFRYWKTKRDARQVGRHWFSQVGGGTNSDTANTQLGVYYKFNEGITGDSSLDSVALDFSGRITNGTFAGYEALYSRNTGSAMIESSASAIEFEDPIIYGDHPSVVSLRTKLLATGSVYDYSNPASLYNTIPAWIIEEDSGAIKNLTQVISSFFDSMHLQMEALPAIRENVLYTSASAKPLPFGKELLESVGLIAPEMFVDADIIEKLAARNDEKIFADDIYNVKNRIYENIYNNLVYIYKSKGTEKSFRNLIRCYGIDREVIDLKVYGSDVTYKIRDNRSAGATRKKYADFYHPDRFNAVVYQQTASANANSVPFITGSGHLTGGWGMTFEAEAIFPAPKKVSETNYFINDFATASIFGIHTVKQTSESETGAEVAWNSPDVANFQVLAAKDYTPGAEDISAGAARFILTGSAGGFFHPALTSSAIPGVYENQRWNFAVKIGPSSYPLSSEVSGTLPTRDNQPYKVEFYGVNLNYNQIENEFYLTASMDGDYAKQFMTSSKRVFVGANKTNFLGGALQKSDAKISSARAWLDVLDNTTILAHAKDPTSFGAAHPYRNAYVFQDCTGSYLPSIETLLLDWDFATVTGSDAGDGGTGYTAGFAVPDVSSGSVTAIPGGTNTYGWLGPMLRSQHTGRGEDYLANQTTVVDTQFLYASKQTLPEYVDSSEMVNILSQDDVNFTLDSRPTNYYFSIEKSMYEAVSRQMIDFFATIKGFNNLIGDPVNRYRQEYKILGKLRQLFFEGVSNSTIDFEKYLEYYKWIDSSLTLMLVQMIPASAKFSEGVRTMVESHVLERNKYWNKFPTLESKFSDPEDAARGINELLYNWKFGHAAPSKGASFADLLTLTGFSDNDKFTVNVATDTGVSGTDITVKMVSGTPSSGTANQVEVSTAGTAAAILARLVIAITGGTPSPSNSVAYGTGAGDATNGVAGISATLGTNPTITVSATRIGSAGNEIVFTDVVGQMVAAGANGSSPAKLTGGIGNQQDVNCFWWKERAERTIGAISASGNPAVNENRTEYLSASLQVLNRRLDSPYKFSAVEVRNIKGGSNAPTNAKEKSVLSTFDNVKDEDSTQLYHDYVYISGSDLEQIEDCDDVLKPVFTDASGNPAAKKRISYYTHTGSANDGSPTEVAKDSAPFTFYSSSVSTGYVKEIQDVAGFEGTALTNLHNDSYGPDYEIPLQGPFTEKYVGGYQYRHVDVNYSSSERDLNTRYDRPEGFRIIMGDEVGSSPGTITVAGGAIDFTGSAADANAGFANRTRETYAKRPVNIANIQQVTSSGVTKIGNFDQNYQVVQTSGRRINNLSIENLTIASSGSSYVTGVIDYTLPTRTTNKSVFVERFSAPGSSEVMARGTRDYTSEEYSPYNALPWRNLTVRQPLNSLFAQHAAKYGMKANTLSSSAQLDNVQHLISASYHKVNQNVARRYENDARWYSNYSIYFDGTNDLYLSGLAISELGLQNSSFSTFAWIKVPTSLSQDGVVFFIGPAGGGLDTIHLRAEESGGTLGRFFVEAQNGASAINSSTYSAQAGEWMHVGVTGRYNGDGGITYSTLYVNGKAVANGAVSASYAGTSKIGIGAEDTGMTSEFKGSITDIAFWNSELTGSDITQLYKFGANQAGPCDLNQHPCSGTLVAWYQMGNAPYMDYGINAEPYMLRDSSRFESPALPHPDANNNPQLFVDAPLGSIIPSPGKWEAVKGGMGTYFDGTSGMYKANLYDIIQGPSIGYNIDFTIGCWIKAETPSEDYGTVWAIYDEGGTGLELLLCVRKSDGKIAIYEEEGDIPASPAAVSTNSIVDGEWHFVSVLHYDSGRTAALYIDGVYVDEGGYFKITYSGVPNLCVGGSPSASADGYGDANPGAFFKGEMAGMQVYDEYLSVTANKHTCRYIGSDSYTFGLVNPYQSMRGILAAGPELGISSSLKAWWRFGNTPGDTPDLIIDGATGSFPLIPHDSVAAGFVRSSMTASGRTVATLGTRIYDNMFVQHAIPQSDSQYMWITSSMLSSDAFGYTTSSTDITFLSSSDLGTYVDPDDAQARRRYATPVAQKGADQFIHDDFVGLNTNLYEPVTSSTNIAGYPLSYSWGLLGERADQIYQGGLVDIWSAFPVSTRTGGEVRMLNGLLNHRNGPYQYPSWKQIRTGEHPVARQHKKESQLSVLPIARQTIRQLGSDYDHKYNADSRRNSFAARSAYMINATQSMVTSKYKPLIHEMGPQRSPNEIILTDTFSNQMETFNEEVNTALYTYLLPRDVDEVHTNIMDATKNGYMPPEHALRKFTYQETIFPRGKNAFLAKVRQREAFIVDFWHPLSGSRTPTNWYDVYTPAGDLIPAAERYWRYVNSQGWPIGTQSIWVLDARYNGHVSGASNVPSSFGRAGELQNRYSIAYGTSSVEPGDSETHFGLGVSYNRAGVPGPDAGTFRGLAGVRWTAGAEAGKNPFYYESYDAYAADIRVKAPDYTIVPEFRISDHMAYYITERNGEFEPHSDPSRARPPTPPTWGSFGRGAQVHEEVPGMLSLTGAVLNNALPAGVVASSSMDGFFEEYSLTDMLKYFDVLDDINEGTDMNPTRLTLSCRAIKKFLPYNGFYPAQRSVQLATLFSQSYGPAMSCSGAPWLAGGRGIAPLGFYPPADQRFRAALQPFFAPGILYNTIKSGLAVDWPIYTGSDDFLTDPTAKDADYNAYVGKNASGSYICLSASYRAPFESLLEPERVLNNIRDIEQQYIDADHPTRGVNEPEINRTEINATASLHGSFDSRYKMAMHNFLAETIDFFLKDSTLTSLVSLPDGDANFGNTGNSVADVFSMDVIISQNVSTGSTPGPLPGPAHMGSAPDPSTLNFPMMYNQIQGKGVAGETGWTDYTGLAFGPPVNSSKEMTDGLNAAIYNWQCFPFTPSHLSYPSIARLEFVPFRGAGEGQVYSLDEILSNMTVKYYHLDGLVDPVGALQFGPAWVDGSQISASLNISQNPAELVKVRAKDVSFGAISRAPEGLSDSESEVLVIQSRFETPILDFRSSSLAARGIYPQPPITHTDANSIVTFGMWHQYGATPPPGEGIFLEIRDSVNADVYDQSLLQWGRLYNLDTPPVRTAVTGSLVDLMGFKRGAEPLGKPAIEKEIKEAVVAIPYQETPDGKDFYPISTQDAHFALSLLEENTVLPTSNPYFELAEQFRKMGEYVMPPQFNCLYYDGWRAGPQGQNRPGTVLPISMFIFEFKHQLTTLDVTDIWQNLPPSIHERMETATATISDDLLLNDLIHLQRHGRTRDIRNIKFMVFKVKQRAKMNYYRKTLDSADDARFSYEQLFGRPGSSKSAEPPYSYNWPYDFFSLVELAKIDASVEYTADAPAPPPAPAGDIAGAADGGDE